MPSLARCWNPCACGLFTPVCPLTKPNSRSRAEPRKSSPPLNDTSFSAGTYVDRSSTAVSGWPASVRQVDDRLAGVEALDEQHVHPRLLELPGRRVRWGRGDVDAEDPVRGVGVVHHVVRAVAGGHDGSVVHGVRPVDLDERTVSRAGHRAGLELGQREPGWAWYRDPGRAEVRRALEVDHCRAEVVLLRRRVGEGHVLHARGTADPHVGQLGREVHAQVVRGTGGGGILQDVPDLLGMRECPA